MGSTKRTVVSLALVVLCGAACSDDKALEPVFRFEPTQAFTVLFGQGDDREGWAIVEISPSGKLTSTWQVFGRDSKGEIGPVTQVRSVDLDAKFVRRLGQMIQGSGLLRIREVESSGSEHPDAPVRVWVLEQGSHKHVLKFRGSTPEPLEKVTAMIHERSGLPGPMRPRSGNGWKDASWETYDAAVERLRESADIAD